MDERQAGQYLSKMFGTATGHISVAYKDTGNSWQEQQFAWPRDKTKLIGWARVHADANVFICPTLRRDAHTRKKGDGINLRWLFADVDWEKVPSAKKALVRKRIEQLGTYIVSSGTGDNVHVYVALSEVVDIEQWQKLNTGLRDYLYADNKQADNSLLRLPGCTNWKTRAGRPVTVRGGNRKMRRPDQLMGLRAFADARVGSMSPNGSVTWSKVDVSKVPVRIRRLSLMDSDEAKGRYGSRHKAVWAVAGDMHKAGLTPDQIHTLMDAFPPALDKRDDEHGAYDVHKDIDRRIKADDAVADDSPFEDLSDADIVALGPDNPLVRKELARRAAMREVEHIEATRRFIAPPPDVSWSLSEAMRHPPQKTKYLVGPPLDEPDAKGLAGVKHNVVITAQYKVGKTAFTVASLAKSLVDGEPFLGRFVVDKRGTIVGHWNCEMEGYELRDDYMLPAQFKHPERMHVANLRGYGVNILTPIGKAWAVSWLKERNVKVWTIDSLARLLRMAGVKEKDNDDVLNVLMAVDEIKVEAGVDVCFIIAHTGRVEQEEGKERARGATVIDDWPDARWIMTRDGEIRFLGVEGRGVGMAVTSLDFNHDTKRSSLGVAGKHEVRADMSVQAVVEIVAANAGIAKEPLVKKVCERLKVRAPAAREYIEEAAEYNWIDVRREARAAGGRAVQKHYPMAKKNDGGATPRAVDFRKVRASRSP